MNRTQTAILIFVIILLYSCHKPHTYTFKRKDYRSLSKKQDHTKLHVKTSKQWSVLDLFRSEQKQMMLRCPDKDSDKIDEKGKIRVEEEEIDDLGASIRRYSRSIHFDIIELEEANLEIPAFKQFKNNMTDFTSDGEEQFKFIISEIRNYLGNNTNGEGVTLKIIGSASQIPTSFDPSKPNNNIRADGSSIPGQTSIENNKKLALARAEELARKIKQVFQAIQIDTPTLDEIELGKTVWNKSSQDRLNDAFLRGDTLAMQRVYEPYQKDQFVLVESQGSYMKTIKPESIEMYLVTVRPKIVYDIEDGQERTISSFIVSKSTYELIGGTLRFGSEQERDNYLHQNHLKKIFDTRHGDQRWFLYRGHKELHAIEIEDDFKRIHEMYKLEMVDEKDKDVLKELIREKYLSNVVTR